MNYITVRLTEDQARFLQEAITSHKMLENLNYWELKTSEQEKQYAFISRIWQAIDAELAKAKNE